MTAMSTTRESEEWDGKAPWNPQWFWPQAILFGFGAAGIVAGLNYHRLGRPRLMWPTIVISSVVFIGVLACLAYVDRGYVVVRAIIINAPAALILFLLQRADYNSFNERMPNGVSGGLDLPVMIGLPWLVVLMALVVAVPPEKTAEKIAQAEEQITQGMDWTRKGDAQRAISSFDEAIKPAPEMAQAYHQRGKGYSILDQREQAIQDFNEAMRLDPHILFSGGVIGCSGRVSTCQVRL